MVCGPHAFRQQERILCLLLSPLTVADTATRTEDDGFFQFYVGMRIIEDIIDTGKTLNYLVPYLKKENPKSIKVCTLLDKKSRRIKNVVPEYIGFEIEDKVVVGDGLDYKDCFRNLPFNGSLAKKGI